MPVIGFGQNVNIPDANFKAYLVGEPLINTNGDAEIQVSEAAIFNGNIGCQSSNISDLTGIEYFTALTSLICSNNQLTTLDVSNNTALISLNCSNNLLELLNTKNGNWQNLDVEAINNNLICVEVDNIGIATNNWSFDSFTTLNINCNYTNPCATVAAIQEYTSNKELLKVTDLLGRETKGTKNEVLFYIYNDGTGEKKIIVE